MFEIGDYAVCPGDGVGEVTDIVEKELGGETNSFYLVKILSNGMTIMVPTDSKDRIRKLVESDEIQNVYGLLVDHDVDIDNSTWNRRNREYTTKIKTGSLVEIAEVLRALFLLKGTKNLSFGEKKMLDRCRQLLAQEIALSKGENEDNIASSIDSCFQEEQQA